VKSLRMWVWCGILKMEMSSEEYENVELVWET
jgi:hypothetical protein